MFGIAPDRKAAWTWTEQSEFEQTKVRNRMFRSKVSTQNSRTGCKHSKITVPFEKWTSCSPYRTAIKIQSFALLPIWSFSKNFFERFFKVAAFFFGIQLCTVKRVVRGTSLGTVQSSYSKFAVNCLETLSRNSATCKARRNMQRVKENW